MVMVPQGPYKKGVNFDVDTIDYNYFIGKYEITLKQYYDFMLSALDSNFIHLQNNELYYTFPGDSLIPKSSFKIGRFDERIFLRNDSVILNTKYSNHPVTEVTWFGAKAFCMFYNFDLPHETEWEKAARGNNDYWFPWGNEIDSTYANYYKSGDPFEPSTTPIGFYNGKNQNGFQTADAVSFYGCYDMAGNAWEWLEDRWTKTTPYNIGKGGGFLYHTPAFLQIYYVSSFGPDKSPDLDMCHLSDGFRVVKRIKDE